MRPSPLLASIESAFPGEVVRTPFGYQPYPARLDHRFLRRPWRLSTRITGRKQLALDPELSWAPKVERWVKEQFSSDDLPDVVWGVSYGRVTSLTSARRLAEMAGAPLVVALQDPVPPPGSSLNEYEETAMATVLAVAARVVVTTNTYAQEVVARFPQAIDKVVVEYASHSELDRVQCPDRSIVRHHGAMNILHAGYLYESEATGVRSLVRALALLQERRPEARRLVRLRTIGGGWGAREALSLARHCGVPEMVRSEAQVPPAQLACETALADCLVVIGPESPLQIPGKLFRYLPAMKPILALFEEGEAATIVRRSGLGVVVSPNHPDAIADALERLWDGCSSGQPLVKPDEDYIEQFSEESMGRRVVEVLEGVMAKSRS
jgi:glycosyltransferase involved in cell wall biosynthesis